MSSSAISASASEQYNSRGREAASSLSILARSKNKRRARKADGKRRDFPFSVGG